MSSSTILLSDALSALYSFSRPSKFILLKVGIVEASAFSVGAGAVFFSGVTNFAAAVSGPVRSTLRDPITSTSGLAAAAVVGEVVGASVFKLSVGSAAFSGVASSSSSTMGGLGAPLRVALAL